MRPAGTQTSLSAPPSSVRGVCLWRHSVAAGAPASTSASQPRRREDQGPRGRAPAVSPAQGNIPGVPLGYFHAHLTARACSCSLPCSRVSWAHAPAAGLAPPRRSSEDAPRVEKLRPRGKGSPRVAALLATQQGGHASHCPPRAWLHRPAGSAGLALCGPGSGRSPGASRRSPAPTGGPALTRASSAAWGPATAPVSSQGSSLTLLPAFAFHLLVRAPGPLGAQHRQKRGLRGKKESRAEPPALRAGQEAFEPGAAVPEQAHLPQGSPVPYEVRVPPPLQVGAQVKWPEGTRCQELWGLSPEPCSPALPGQDPAGCPLRPLQPGWTGLGQGLGSVFKAEIPESNSVLGSPSSFLAREKEAPRHALPHSQKSCLVEAGEAASSRGAAADVAVSSGHRGGGGGGPPTGPACHVEGLVPAGSSVGLLQRELRGLPRRRPQGHTDHAGPPAQGPPTPPDPLPTKPGDAAPRSAHPGGRP